METQELLKSLNEIANEIDRIKQAASSVLGNAEITLRKLSTIYTELAKTQPELQNKG